MSRLLTDRLILLHNRTENLSLTCAIIEEVGVRELVRSTGPYSRVEKWYLEWFIPTSWTFDSSPCNKLCISGRVVVAHWVSIAPKQMTMPNKSLSTLSA